MGTEEFGSAIDPTMSLEEFLLMRLKMTAEQLEEPAMTEPVIGGYITLAQCLQLVKIAKNHDELAEALKEAVAAIQKRSPKEAAFHKQFCLTVLNKLEAEKKGEPIDWTYCDKLRPDSSFLMKEMRRVWK